MTPDIVTATALLYVLPFMIIGAIHAFYKWTIYKKIKNTGIAGFGRLFSCGRSYLIGAEKFNPIIEFYYNEQHYKILAMGFYGKPPCEVGDEIAILFSEKYPKSVVIKDMDMQPGYIFWILFFFAICAAIVLYYVYSLLAYSVNAF